MKTDELIDAVIQWGRDHGITNMESQANKVTEEWGETLMEMNHLRFGDAFEDGIGDTLVSLIIYADITGLDIRQCLEKTYNVIKDRVGQTVDGNFVKEAEI